jgi:hypothetical protein
LLLLLLVVDSNTGWRTAVGAGLLLLLRLWCQRLAAILLLLG